MLQRPRHVVLAFAGFALVTFVLVSLLAVIGGLQQVAARTGSPDVALVMQAGHDSSGSSLADDAVGIIAGMPGVATVRGKPLVAPELLATAKVSRRSSGVKSSVRVRGVTPGVFAMTPHFAIVAGRQFKPGTNEIIAGQAAARAFRWLTPGATQKFVNTQWKVVGTFKANGGYQGSEIWVDMHTLQSALNAGGRISVVLAKLTSANAFPAFKKAVEADKRLHAQAVRQSEAHAWTSRFLTQYIRIAIWAIALMLGAGAIVGVLNIMSTALMSRTREVALYRALGFQKTAVVTALLGAIVLIGLAGGLVGGIVAALVFNGYQAVTSTGSRQLAFELAASPLTIGVGVAYALGLGFLSGIVPAWQAGRRSVIAALRGA